MFRIGFEKTASILKLPKPHVNPVTAQDALGATKRIGFSKPIARFASGHHPKAGLKGLSEVGRAR